MSSLTQPISTRSLEDKTAIYNMIREKHPGKIPVVFLMNFRAKMSPNVEIKFIVTANTVLFYLSNQIRAQLEMNADNSLYFYTNTGKILKQDSSIAEIFDDFKDESGFLFIEFSEVEYLG